VRAYQEEVEAQRSAGSNYQPKDFDDLDVLSESIDAEYLDELARRQEERERRRREQAAAGEAGAGA
jgi:hypothetical protein